MNRVAECPFCKVIPKVYNIDRDYIVECQNYPKCGVCPSVRRKTKSGAIGIWNTRQGEMNDIEVIKQAIIQLAYGCQHETGTDRYYAICKMLYPNFVPPTQSA